MKKPIFSMQFHNGFTLKFKQYFILTNSITHVKDIFHALMFVWLSFAYLTYCFIQWSHIPSSSLYYGHLHWLTLFLFPIFHLTREDTRIEYLGMLNAQQSGVFTIRIHLCNGPHAPVKVTQLGQGWRLQQACIWQQNQFLLYHFSTSMTSYIYTFHSSKRKKEKKNEN